MTQEEIRVGIVGADTKASWAKVSHVPAIKDLPGVRLAAVATRRERSAGRQRKPSVPIAGIPTPSP
jgi:predicted dehydrogenase